MKQKELREKMPEIAAWVDEMVAVFGKDEVHGQIRRGIAGELTFYAQENGHTVGTRIATGSRSLIVWDERGMSKVVNQEEGHG